MPDNDAPLIRYSPAEAEIAELLALVITEIGMHDGGQHERSLTVCDTGESRSLTHGVHS